MKRCQSQKDANCLPRMNFQFFYLLRYVIMMQAASFFWCVCFSGTACNDSFLSMARSLMVQTFCPAGPWIVLFGTPSTYAASWHVRRCCGGTSYCCRPMPWIQLPAWQLSVRWHEETHQNAMDFLDFFFVPQEDDVFFKNSF